MQFQVIIPARYQSSRLPGKPLAMINGKSMIERVYRQAELSGATSVAVATDDQRIQTHVEAFGGKVVMTRRDHESGTDRIFEACRLLDCQPDDTIVNVQGDEPFIPPETISQVAKLLHSKHSVMSTLCTPIKSSDEVNNPNVVKTILNLKGQAIYFSRSAIPFNRDNISFDSIRYFRHLGIYGFKFHFLETFSNLPMSSLESVEKLEQLRAIENGYAIEMATACSLPAMGVDTEDDLKQANEYAKKLES